MKKYYIFIILGVCILLTFVFIYVFNCNQIEYEIGRYLKENVSENEEFVIISLKESINLNDYVDEYINDTSYDFQFFDYSKYIFTIDEKAIYHVYKNNEWSKRIVSLNDEKTLDNNEQIYSLYNKQCLNQFENIINNNIRRFEISYSLDNKEYNKIIYVNDEYIEILDNDWFSNYNISLETLKYDKYKINKKISNKKMSKLKETNFNIWN